MALQIGAIGTEEYKFGALTGGRRVTGSPYVEFEPTTKKIGGVNPYERIGSGELVASTVGGSTGYNGPELRNGVTGAKFDTARLGYVDYGY